MPEILVLPVNVKHKYWSLVPEISLLLRSLITIYFRLNNYLAFRLLLVQVSIMPAREFHQFQDYSNRSELLSYFVSS